MRITIHSIPLALVIILPIYATFFGWNCLQVTLALILIAITRQILVLKPIFSPTEEETLVLNTTCSSHYVEKVRWCMDYLALDYTEEQDINALGILLLGRRVPTLHIPEKRITVSNSADILRYLCGIRGHLAKKFVSRSRDKAKVANKIQEFLEPFEADKCVEWEEKLDKLGEDCRRIAYGMIFHDETPENKTRILQKVLGLQQPQIPSWQKKAMQMFMPLIVSSISKRNNVIPEKILESRKAIFKTLDELEELMKDGRKFIFGKEQPCYLDMHCAAVSCIGVMPKNYGGASIAPETKWYLQDFGPKVQEFVNELRGSPAGQKILNLYQDYRFANILK